MPTSPLELEQVTPNVFTTTKLRGCNPSFVVTSDGVVCIDTPQLPTKAVAMRAAAEAHGSIRYLINTENHVDHIFGNYWYRGAGEIVNHQALWDIFMDPKAALDPFEFIRTIAVSRIVMPESMVRLSAGREDMSEEIQALCLLAGANSIFCGPKLLTTPNPARDRDMAMLEKLGFTPMA